MAMELICSQYSWIFLDWFATWLY